MSKIVIIGAGVAGLTAAMHLQNKGHNVTIYEATSHIGGRCFSYFDKKFNAELDNGQHLFSSVYSNFFELIKWLGNENLFNEKSNIKVNFVEINDVKNYSWTLDCTKYKGKLGLIYGMFKIKKINMIDKIRAIRLLKQIYINDFQIEDISVLQLLNKYKISQNAIKKLWKPLVVSMLNTPITEASAFLFINVLRKLTLNTNDSLNLLYSKTPLSQLFKGLENKFINTNNKLHFNTPIKKLLVDNNKCCGVMTFSGEKIYSDHVISTIPLNVIDKYYINNFNYSSLFQQSTIISVHLMLNRQIHSEPYIAYIGTNIEWIFNLNILYNIKNNDTYKYSITISNATMLDNITVSEIMAIIKLELKKIAKIEESNILNYRVLKSKNATPLFTYRNNSLRPKVKSDIENFFLAGDWVRTNLPATIESAAMSGKMAADYILNI